MFYRNFYLFDGLRDSGDYWDIDMHRNAKDPELNTMANELRTLVWLNPMDALEEKNLTENAMGLGMDRKRRLVTPLPGYRDLAVRLHLGGEQRTVGICSANQMPQALRFADMVQMQFWKYRLRGASPPSEDQLNRWKSLVEADMAGETNAVDLLQRIEKYLLERGVIHSGPDRAKAKKSNHPENLRTLVRGNHLETVEMLGGINHQLGELRDAQKLIVESLQAIARMVTAKNT